MSTTTPLPGVLPAENHSKRPNWLLRIGITAVLIIGGIGVLLPNLCKPRETANRAKCASNLHQIGLGILLYTADHAGCYPDSLATILKNEQLTSAVCVCPSSNDEAAIGDTSDAMIQNLNRPHHCSYIYVGNGLTTANVKDGTVIAYEPPENHQGDGMNMLFGDGHVEWESMAQTKRLIAKATAATQPVMAATRYKSRTRILFASAVP